MTKEEQTKLRELHTAQMTVKEIAERMQKPKAEIRQGLVAMGYLPIENKPTPESEFLKGRQPVEIPTRKYQKITPKVKKRICELREQCFTLRQIAEKLNIKSEETVRFVLVQNGYPTKRGEYHKVDKPMTLGDVFDRLDKEVQEFNAAVDEVTQTKKEPAPVAADTSSETIIPVINDNTPEPKCQAPEPLSAIKLLELIQAMIVTAYGLEAVPTYIQADSALGIYRFAYEGYEYGFTFGMEMEVPEYGNDKH